MRRWVLPLHGPRAATVSKDYTVIWPWTNQQFLGRTNDPRPSLKQVKQSRYRHELAYRVDTDIALPFPDLGARTGWAVSTTPRPLYPVPIVQEAGWVPGPAWTCSKNLAPPPGIDPRTVQPVANRYTDWGTRHTLYDQLQKRSRPAVGPTETFPGRGGGINLITHLHVVPRKGMGGAIPLHPYTPVRHGNDNTLYDEFEWLEANNYCSLFTKCGACSPTVDYKQYILSALT
jgi:hypothetical protein